MVFLNVDNNIKGGREFFFEFANELKKKNRFFINPIYLKVFDTIIKQCSYSIDTYKTLYRGRINSRNITDPYVGKDIGMPKPEVSTSHGRANPYGINYMYLSDNNDTVIAELRPNIGDIVSIGQFKLLKPKTVVKLGSSGSISGTINDEFDSLFISEFMMYLILSFSRPIDANNKEIEYLPSQYFSEYCKTKEFDGIMFLSSVMGQNINKNHNYNCVFFNDLDLIYKSTDVYIVNSLKYNSDKMG